MNYTALTVLLASLTTQAFAMDMMHGSKNMMMKHDKEMMQDGMMKNHKNKKMMNDKMSMNKKMDMKMGMMSDHISALLHHDEGAH